MIVHCHCQQISGETSSSGHLPCQKWWGWGGGEGGGGALLFPVQSDFRVQKQIREIVVHQQTCPNYVNVDIDYNYKDSSHTDQTNTQTKKTRKKKKEEEKKKEKDRKS